jgi:hypothetical protein
MTRVMPRMVVSRVLAVVVLLASAGIAFWSWLFVGFSGENMVGSPAGPESWLVREAAWQWDAIIALGLASLLAAAYFVWACFKGRRGAALAGAAGWIIIAAVLWSLIWPSSPNSGSDLVLWQFAIAALLVTSLFIIPAERLDH